MVSEAKNIAKAEAFGERIIYFRLEYRFRFFVSLRSDFCDKVCEPYTSGYRKTECYWI